MKSITALWGKEGVYKKEHSPQPIIHIPLTPFSPLDTPRPFRRFIVCMCVFVKRSLIFNALCLGDSVHVHKFSVCTCVWGDFVYSVARMSWLGVTSFEFVSFSLTFNSPTGWSPPGIDESWSPYWVEIKSASLSCEVIRYDPSRTQTHMFTYGFLAEVGVSQKHASDK